MIYRKQNMDDNQHYLEREYGAVFLNVAMFLEPEVLAQMSINKTTSVSLKKLYIDPLFWKLRFEQEIDRTFAPNQQPGKTSWLWKYKKVRDDGIEGLLYSYEVFDFDLAYTNSTKFIVGDIEDIANFLRPIMSNPIAHALANPNDDPLTSNEDVLRYMAINKVPGFSEAAANAFSNGYVMFMDKGQKESVNISAETMRMLADDGLTLDLDYVAAMENAIIRGDMTAVEFLSTLMEADVEGYSEHYTLTAARYDQADILDYLLGLPETYVSEELANDMYSTANENDFLDVLDVLTSHPSTSQYFEE